MVHAMGLGNRENQFQSDSGVMIPAIGLVDLISDVPVPMGMVVMAQAEADFSDVSAGPVFHDGPSIEGKPVLAAFDGFEQAKGNDVSFDGKELFLEWTIFHMVLSPKCSKASPSFCSRSCEFGRLPTGRLACPSSFSSSRQIVRSDLFDRFRWQTR